jgi:hypothetical protein
MPFTATGTLKTASSVICVYFAIGNLSWTALNMSLKCAPHALCVTAKCIFTNGKRQKYVFDAPVTRIAVGMP